MTLDEGRLKDAERLIRFAMVVTLCTAGISKFFSHGAFNQYYGELFRNPQFRIHLSSFPRLDPGTCLLRDDEGAGVPTWKWQTHSSSSRLTDDKSTSGD